MKISLTQAEKFTEEEMRRSFIHVTLSQVCRLASSLSDWFYPRSLKKLNTQIFLSLNILENIWDPVFKS